MGTQREEHARIMTYSKRFIMPSTGPAESAAQKRNRMLMSKQILRIDGFTGNGSAANKRKMVAEKAKKMFLKLSRLLHPDKLRDDLAGKNEAYHLLNYANTSLQE